MFHIGGSQEFGIALKRSPSQDPIQRHDQPGKSHQRNAPGDRPPRWTHIHHRMGSVHNANGMNHYGKNAKQRCKLTFNEHRQIDLN